MACLFVTFFTLIFLLIPAYAEDFSPAQKQQIETVVHDYLLKNPDILREVFFALEKQEKEKLQVSQKKAVEDYARLLTNSDKQAVIGNPDGDVTLVEFFDYNCGFCKGDEPNVQRLIREDKSLRVVLKEYPILSQGSIDAALVSAQLRKDARYAEFHHTLLSEKGEIDKQRALETAKKLGFDTAKLEAGMKDEAVRAVPQESYKLADALSINGTPAYVIGHDVYPGTQSYETLKTAIGNVRKCGKAEC